jgi:hypothetical protein
VVNAWVIATCNLGCSGGVGKAAWVLGEQAMGTLQSVCLQYHTTP